MGLFRPARFAPASAHRIEQPLALEQFAERRLQALDVVAREAGHGCGGSAVDQAVDQATGDADDAALGGPVIGILVVALHVDDEVGMLAMGGLAEGPVALRLDVRERRRQGVLVIGLLRRTAGELQEVAAPGGDDEARRPAP